MIFSLHKTKKQKRNAGILRTLSSALIAVVIGVNIFGAFAGVVSAQTAQQPPQTIEQARTYLNQAITIARQAQNNTDPVNGQLLINQSRTAWEQARTIASTLPSTPAVQQLRTEISVFAEPGRISPTSDFQLALNRQIENMRASGATPESITRARETAIGGGSTPPGGSGTSPPQTGKTAKHPVDICFSKDITAAICIASIFYVFFVDLTSPIAYLSGAVFDAFANISLESGTYASAVIAKGWVIARDVANMAFVFILIYIAFMLILNLEGVGIARQIAGVIAVALLINFSFFFSRVVIDMSNILAHEFYDQIYASRSEAAPSALVSGVQMLAPISISEKVMAGVNPQTLISADGFQKFLSGGTFVGNLAILITLFLIFGIVNVILAAVFLTAAFQFLARIVALWFAIILSPIAFISFITPKMNGLWSKWLKLLLNNAFYAPAFLFVIYIAVKMLDNGLISANIASFLGGAANAPGAAENAMRTFLNSIVGVILRLSIVVGLFIAALKVGSFVGAEGASKVEGWGKKLAIGGNAAFVGGVGGFAGRKILGGAGYLATRSQTVRNLASGDTLKGRTFVGAQTIRNIGSRFGRGLEVTGGKLATSSFDIRASGLPEAKLGGKAQSGGYKKDVEEKTKKLEAIDHDRHATPEEKTILENKAKTEKNYTARKEAIDQEFDASIASAKGAKASAEIRLSSATQQFARASELNDQAEIQRAQAQITSARRDIKTADDSHKSLEKIKKSRIETLDKEISDAVGKGDKERKEAFAKSRESRFWITRSRADDRVAYNLRHDKSKKDKFADAAKDYLKEIEPPAEGGDSHGPPPPPPTPQSTGGGGGGGTPPPAAGGGGGAHH